MQEEARLHIGRCLKNELYRFTQTLQMTASAASPKAINGQCKCSSIDRSIDMTPYNIKLTVPRSVRLCLGTPVPGFVAMAGTNVYVTCWALHDVYKFCAFLAMRNIRNAMKRNVLFAQYRAYHSEPLIVCPRRQKCGTATCVVVLLLLCPPLSLFSSYDLCPAISNKVTLIH